MSSETPSSGPWARLIAGLGVAISLLAIVRLVAGIDEQPGLLSWWLLISGLTLAFLCAHTMRGERVTLALLRARQAERDQAERARRAAEARSHELAETSPDMLTEHRADGSLSYVSPACRQLLGYEPEELLDRTVDDLVHPDDGPVLAAARNRLRETDDVTATFRLRRRDDRHLWVEAKLHILRDAGGSVAEVHAVVRDVDERVEAQRTLAEAEERFRTAFEEGDVGMAITDPNGRLLRVNRALCRITGHTRSDLEGRGLASLLHPDDRDEHRREQARLLSGDLRSSRAEVRCLHDEGRVVWIALSTTLVHDATGAPLHFLSQAQDVTERRRFESELRFMADHDPLTGLLNRRAFERELERHVDHVGRYGACGAVLLLDVDYFKNVNDTLGHSAGDRLIGKVADALRQRLRERDVVARLGGDEFAILLPDGGREAAEAVARDVLATIRDQRIPTPSGRLRTVSASVGLALFEDDRLTGEEVLVNADLAMYDAKEQGRDRMVCFVPHPDTASRLEARVSWTDAIRDALDENRFVLQAQPIMDLASGEIGQYELLLRMRDPLGELISPGAFLPVAERYDMIGAIDRWVVGRSIDMLGEERRRGRKLVFEVNISGRSTGDPELLTLIERRLHDNGVEPQQIIFEVTETTAVGNIPRAQEFAGHLAELGCRFALDDFGAAFASFYYLKHLPFDYLKIDGEFVRSCTGNRTDQLVIQAVVDIARGLGKRTVAEMVGDQETMDLLRGMGIDQVQGFHIGRPAPLAKWLVEARRAEERRAKEEQRRIAARARGAIPARATR